MSTQRLTIGGFSVPLATSGPEIARPAAHRPVPTGGLWTTLRPPARSFRDDTANPAASPVISRPDVSAGLLVWRSASHGTPLARGQAMTQGEAVHYCTGPAHGQNELVVAATTPTQITYRTASGTEVVYRGTRLVRQHRRPAGADAHR